MRSFPTLLTKILTIVLFVFAFDAYSPAQVVQKAPTGRPALNGLEKGEAARRAISLNIANSRVTSDQKEVTNAAAKLAAATTPKAKQTAQAQVDQANKRLAQDQKTQANEQTRRDSWEASVKTSHHMPPNAKIDWKGGTIAPPSN